MKLIWTCTECKEPCTLSMDASDQYEEVFPDACPLGLYNEDTTSDDKSDWQIINAPCDTCSGEGGDCMECGGTGCAEVDHG